VNITELLDDVSLDGLGFTPTAAALNVLRRQSAKLARMQANRDTLVLLAREVGASYADIAEAAGFTPQTAANICHRHAND
jgi:DNA-directed RNA polymerase specialized sigma24 family protein